MRVVCVCVLCACVFLDLFAFRRRLDSRGWDPVGIVAALCLLDVWQPTMPRRDTKMKKQEAF